MLAGYDDILDAITEGIREGHDNFKSEYSRLPDNCVSSPTDDRCTCVAKPLWWDKNGVPRFAAHHPKLCSNIYADEVARARDLWDELGGDVAEAGSEDLFLERLYKIDDHEVIGDDLWDYLETETAPMYNVLLYGILPALVVECKKAVAYRERREAAGAPS